MEEKKILFKETDLLDILSRVIKKWKFIFIVTLCFIVLGLIVVFSSVKSYTSEMVVAPETSSSSNVSSSINSLASMMGVNIGMNENEAIYPLLYPDIISSLPFLTSLFDVEVSNLDSTVDTTYYAYIEHFREETWLDDFKKIPSKTIAWVKNLFSSSQEELDVNDFNPYMLSKTQMIMVENLKSNIGVFVDKKTDVITLSFTDRDPRVAAIMADTIMNRLQQEITAYRTKKANDDCVYIEQMYLESKDSLEASQKRYTDFITRNRNVVNEYVLVEKERLAADKDLKTTLYTQWAQQLLLAKAKVQERTPVFVTLKPAAIPAIASSMGRSTMLMLFALFGGFFAIIYVLLKDSLINILKKMFTFK